MGDTDLRQHILDELAFDPAVDANEIGVAVENGIVTLSGHVPTYPAKLAAEYAVLRVKGVKAIAQEIQVRHHPGHGHSDDEIAHRIVEMFKWSTLIPDDCVQVKVQHGWVTLTGEVAWDYQRVGAETIVHGVRGVRGIDNLIGLKPRVVTGDVKREIQQAFDRNAEIEGRDLHIAVEGNQVVLDGVVHSWHERRLAEQAAMLVPGVHSVRNNLRVG